jgi:hypothetical protein
MKWKASFRPFAPRSADCQSAVSRIGNPPSSQIVKTSPNTIRRHGRLTICVTLAALAPSPLFACAACYGKSDSPLASGMNWGIFTLMGVILTVLTCITLFFVHVIRGEKAQIEADNNPTPQDPPKV